MWKSLFKETGTKATITLFHNPSLPASTRVLTLLKQASAQSTSNATQDQASSTSSGASPNTEGYQPFELDVQTSDPTTDQLRNIIQFTGSVEKAVEGANSEEDAFNALKGGRGGLRRPIVVDWTGGRAVVGGEEGQIVQMLKSLKS